jgi:hypothetical protein
MEFADHSLFNLIGDWMKFLRRSLIALLIAIAVFLKIERIGLEDVPVIDIQRFVYVLGIGAVVLTILIPALRRASISITLALWTSIYLLGKVVFFSDVHHPLFGDLHIYITITEIAFVNLLVLLARNVARDLNDFEEAVENITLGEINRHIQKMDAATDDIQAELIRSRRHHRPLAVIVVEPIPGSLKTVLHRTIEEVQHAMIARYIFTSLGRALGNVIRRTDIVLADSERNRFVVFCPETDSQGSQELRERLYEIADRQMGIQVNCGIGAFPDEALTFEELVRRAESQLTSKPQILTQPALESNSAK